MKTLEELKNERKLNIENLQPEKKVESDEEDFSATRKLKNGKNTARQVPFENGNVVLKVAVHWPKGGAPFICPRGVQRDRNVPCPACEHAWESFNSVKGPDGKGTKTPTWKLWVPQDQYLTLMIFRDQEKADIEKYGHPRLRWYNFSKKAWEQTAAILADVENYGEITDFTEGRDITLEYNEEAAKAGQLSVSVRAAGKSSIVFAGMKESDPKLVQMLNQMLEKAPKLEEKFKILNSDQIFNEMASYNERQKKFAAKNAEKKAEEAANDDDDFDDESPEFKAALARGQEAKSVSDLAS